MLERISQSYMRETFINFSKTLATPIILMNDRFHTFKQGINWLVKMNFPIQYVKHLTDFK